MKTLFVNDDTHIDTNVLTFSEIRHLNTYGSKPSNYKYPVVMQTHDLICCRMNLAGNVQ